MVTSYLTAEQAGGCIAAAADIPTLSHTLIGSVHLLFTDRENGTPDAEALGGVVGAAVGQGGAQRGWSLGADH